MRHPLPRCLPAAGDFSPPLSRLFWILTGETERIDSHFGREGRQREGKFAQDRHLSPGHGTRDKV